MNVEVTVVETSAVRSHKDLTVWKSAISLVERVYRDTSKIPRDEMYGLTSQIRRASVSIAANVAEGCGRGSTPQFIQFLRISQGSAQELDTHIIISEKLGFLDRDATFRLQDACRQIGLMLRGLIYSLEATLSKQDRRQRFTQPLDSLIHWTV